MDFKEINNQIQENIKNLKIKGYSLDDKDFKLPLSDAIFCSGDVIRNKFFYSAIKKAIIDLKKKKEKIKVIDAGSGTGILGIFALFLGADNCLFIENNPYSLDLNKKLIKSFGLESKASFILGDAIKTELEDKYDLLISETISIDFSREDFLEIVSNLKKSLNKDSIVIPESFEIDIRKKNSIGKILKTKKLNFNSKDYLKDLKIIPKKEEGFNFELSGKVILYKDLILKSGNCISFFNKKNI